MKIVSVDVMQVPSGNAGASRGDWCPVIVRINTDEGISGFGEVGLAYGKGWRAGMGMVQDFAEVIIGEDPMQIERIWEMIFRTTFWGMGGGTVVSAAMSGIDIALWDIKGKALACLCGSLWAAKPTTICAPMPASCSSTGAVTSASSALSSPKNTPK